MAVNPNRRDRIVIKDFINCFCLSVCFGCLFLKYTHKEQISVSDQLNICPNAVGPKHWQNNAREGIAIKLEG
jgi:hypothetical protein